MAGRLDKIGEHCIRCQRILFLQFLSWKKEEVNSSSITLDEILKIWYGLMYNRRLEHAVRSVLLCQSSLLHHVITYDMISSLSSNATRWILLKVSRLTTAQAIQNENDRPVKIMREVLGYQIFPVNGLLQLQLA